jgi:hypothetical protein
MNHEMQTPKNQRTEIFNRRGRRGRAEETRPHGFWFLCGSLRSSAPSAVKDLWFCLSTCLLPDIP